MLEEVLEKDKLVKIKGFGTFKLVDIDSRESVNINTGERFLIDGYKKMTFTPDASLRDLINKPFEHFEAVVVNDGVVLEDTPIEEAENEPIETSLETELDNNESKINEANIEVTNLPVVEDTSSEVTEIMMPLLEESVSTNEESSATSEESIIPTELLLEDNDDKTPSNEELLITDEVALTENAHSQIEEDLSSPIQVNDVENPEEKSEAKNPL